MQRPKNFKVEPGAGKVVITLKPYQPSADEKAIQHKWEVVGRTEDGKTVAEQGSANTSYLSFYDRTGPLCTFGNYPKVDQTSLSIYITDPEKEPKTIKFFPV